MAPRRIVAQACALALIIGCSEGGGGDGHVDGTGTIGPAGGTVSLSRGPTVQVPAGALSASTALTISASSVTAPSGAVTAVYQFGPEGTSFAVPIRVSFPVPAGTKASDVAVYWTRKGSTADWELLPASLSGTTASAETNHFSAGFVGAACAAGADCTPPNPCRVGVTTCNGTPVCTDTGNVPDGTACGTLLTCSAGTCACVAGTACAPSDACHTGAVACDASGSPRCVQTALAPGTACGSNQVCDSTGGCVSCTQGTTCTSATDPLCKTAAITCDTGAPVCTDTGNAPDGTACGGGDLCAAGTCGPSYAGPIAIARTYLVTPTGSAAFFQADEVSQHSPPNVTRTVISSNAPNYMVRSFTFDAGAVLLDGVTTYQEDGTPISATTYAPPQLVIPADTTAGATASSTSTATTTTGANTTTFTVTRSMTVNGVEDVTVPAGTFSALKITTAIVQSNFPPSHVVNWWALGIGSARAVSSPDANPSATTVTELLRTSPMVCSGDSCACNALVDSAAEVQSVLVAASLPAPAGGAIQDGTYHLTAERIYTGVGGASGPTGQTTAVVLAFQAGTLQIASRRSGVEERSTLGYDVSGVDLILTPLCGAGSGDPERLGFTAAGAELQLLDPGTPPEPGKEAVLTRQ